MASVCLQQVIVWLSVLQSQRRDNPTVKERLRLMQTTLESGAGDYSADFVFAMRASR
jgi:hypothetical protein